jgi:hypothetical protein
MDWLIRLKSAWRSLGPSFLRRCGDLWYRKANPQPCHILTRTQLLCAQARFSYGRSNARTMFIRLESHIWKKLFTQLQPDFSVTLFLLPAKVLQDLKLKSLTFGSNTHNFIIRCVTNVRICYTNTTNISEKKVTHYFKVQEFSILFAES